MRQRFIERHKSLAIYTNFVDEEAFINASILDNEVDAMAIILHTINK
jgi:hypothetical protein